MVIRSRAVARSGMLRSRQADDDSAFNEYLGVRCEDGESGRDAVLVWRPTISTVAAWSMAVSRPGSTRWARQDLRDPGMVVRDDVAECSSRADEAGGYRERGSRAGETRCRARRKTRQINGMPHPRLWHLGPIGLRSGSADIATAPDHAVPRRLRVGRSSPPGVITRPHP
jgi:hypothetical protein